MNSGYKYYSKNDKVCGLIVCCRLNNSIVEKFNQELSLTELTLCFRETLEVILNMLVEEEFVDVLTKNISFNNIDVL